MVEVAKGAAFRRDNYRTGNDDTDRALLDVQQRVSETVDSKGNSPFAQGRILPNVSLTTGSTNRIAHKLNRKYVAWSIVRKSADANVWESSYSSPDNPKKFLVLDCSADVKVDILVG